MEDPSLGGSTDPSTTTDPPSTTDSLRVLTVPFPYTIKKSEHPKGLIVINADNPPPENTLIPILQTSGQEVNLPLNGWPQGGGVIFL
jgi:hypothetical protein